MTHRILTVEQRAAYLANPSKCPFCGGRPRLGEAEVQHRPHLYIKANCDSCLREWVEHYEMIAVHSPTLCARCGKHLADGGKIYWHLDRPYHKECPGPDEPFDLRELESRMVPTADVLFGKITRGAADV